MGKRDAKILEAVAARGRIEVAKLAESLGVSQVTMRKDLDLLEKKGILRREHGFAILSSQDDISYRLAFAYEAKRAIARHAAARVGDGETVMIESGSCCALLAEALTESVRSITIVTNSAFIAGYVRKRPGAQIVLLGGDYQNEAQVMVGPITRQCAKNFFVDRFFIGADGFSKEQGFTGRDFNRAETVRAMAKQAKNVIVLTQSEKFSQQGVVALLPAEEVAMVCTDHGIPAEIEAHLNKKGVAVEKASTL